MFTTILGAKLRDRVRLFIKNVYHTRYGRAGDSLKQRVEMANSQEVDILASVHFNTFNGQANGSQIFANSTLAKTIATIVLKNIVNFGFQNRGVKDGSHLYILKNTKMPSILIKCCFCDSKSDM
jgi:N-acetylmuramoyl-L-alanine amidase